MGWPWSSTVAPAQLKPQETPLTTQQPSSMPQSTKSTSYLPHLSRDELAERELRSFLQELDADIHSSSSKYNRVPKQSPYPTCSSDSPIIPSHDPLSEQLLPTTMSCREAFDAAFYCNSLGGQFNNVYRYGSIQPCSETWGDFWFCMRVRTTGGEQKAKAIREHYRKKEQIKYSRDNNSRDQEELGRSSEDIWRTRDKKLEWGAAFNHPFPPPFEGNAAEYIEMEKERRRQRKLELEAMVKS
jgi:hypothetical protein